MDGHVKVCIGVRQLRVQHKAHQADILKPCYAVIRHVFPLVSECDD